MRRAIVLAGAIALVAPRAHAAPPSEGEVLFREGRSAMQEKDYERACAKFAESQRKDPAPGTALNLGECEERRGHLVAASEAFVVAASTFSTPDKQKYASTRAEAMDRRVPRLTIRSSAKTAGLSIRVGKQTVSVDTEMRMDPGDVQVHTEAPGHRPKDLRATLREGKSLEIDIGSLDADNVVMTTKVTGQAATATPPPRKSSGFDLRTAGLVIGGAGVASLIVGGVTGVIALGKASTVEERCDGGLACDQEGLDAARSGDTFSLISTMTFIAGGVAVVGGGALFFLNPRSKLSVNPTASHDSGGLTFRGVF